MFEFDYAVNYYDGETSDAVKHEMTVSSINMIKLEHLILCIRLFIPPVYVYISVSMKSIVFKYILKSCYFFPEIYP